MAGAALASLKAAAAECFAAQAVFDPDEATAGLLAADNLRALFLPLARGRPPAPATGVQPPFSRQAVAAEQAPLTLLRLPPELLVLVICRLDVISLARVAATCSGLYRDQPRPMTPVEEVLRERAAARGHVSPGCLPNGATSWAAHLAWLERRRDEAWAPVAACSASSFFVAEGGQLMSCGTEDDNLVRQFTGADATGLLGHGELDADDPVIPTPTLLPSMTGIRIRSVSAGIGFNAAVSAAGKVYTWGVGSGGRLGHGNEESSLVPKQVQTLVEHPILSVSAGSGHCLAVTERGEVFSWGITENGQCGHGSSSPDQLLPRRVEALTVARVVRSVSAGGHHSLVVTEEGALYSFGRGHEWQLGHGSVGEEHSPKIVEALRHVRIATAAAGSSFSLALAEDGTVFSWGANGYGQLGRGRIGGDEALPQKVEALSGLQVRAVVGCGGASCAVTAAGELFTWGGGDVGQLGHGEETNQVAPKRVEALRDKWCVAVSAGAYHTIAVMRNGGVFGWGAEVGLGLPEAPADAVHDRDEEDQELRILSSCRYPQLSCAPHSGAV